MSKVKYEILKGDKLKKFIDKYMSKWEQDIIKVSCLTYKNSLVKAIFLIKSIFKNFSKFF